MRRQNDADSSASSTNPVRTTSILGAASFRSRFPEGRRSSSDQVAGRLLLARDFYGCLKFAIAVEEPFTLIVHAPSPWQAPVQPVNVDPAAAVAASVTTLPPH